MNFFRKTALPRLIYLHSNSYFRGMNKKLFAYAALVTALITTGCGVTGNALNTETGALKVSKLEEVDKQDYFVAASSTLPFLVMEYTSSTINLGIPFDLKYHSYFTGDADLKFNYPLIIETDEFNQQGDPVTDDLSKLQVRFNYGYPVYGFFTKKDEVRVSFGSIDDKSYYGIVPARLLNQINVRAGFVKDYTQTQTQMHNDYLKNKYEDLSLFTPDDAVVRQSQNYLKVGLSFQRFQHIALEGTGDGKMMKGKETSLISFYADLNFLISSKLDQVYTRYTAYEPGTFNIIDEFDGAYDLTTVLPEQKIGFTVGMEFVIADGDKHNFFITQGLELGTRPGYYDRSMQGFYIGYSIKYGIGMASK